jgi:hypothetical protein
MVLTTHPLLAPRSRENRALPQPHHPLWAFGSVTGNLYLFKKEGPILVAAWVCGRLPAEIVGSNPDGGEAVSCECCLLSGKGLCDGLVQRIPVVCVYVCVGRGRQKNKRGWGGVIQAALIAEA